MQPYVRLPYSEAIAILQRAGKTFEFFHTPIV